MQEHDKNETATFEILDSDQLAARLKLPPTWMRDSTRSRSVDPPPHFKFGRYVRFRWGSPELQAWLERRLVGGSKHHRA